MRLYQILVLVYSTILNNLVCQNHALLVLNVVLNSIAWHVNRLKIWIESIESIEIQIRNSISNQHQHHTNEVGAKPTTTTEATTMLPPT